MKIYCNRRVRNLDYYVGKDIWMLARISKQHKSRSKVLWPSKLYYIQLKYKPSIRGLNGQYTYQVCAIPENDIYHNNYDFTAINDLISGWICYSVPENEILLIDNKESLSTRDIEEYLKEHSSRYSG